MKTVHARSYKLFDYHFDSQWNALVEHRWNYSDFLKNKAWRKGWISFDCLYYEKESGIIYCGVTSFENDIFHGFDTEKKIFIPTGYERIADPYDAKFHRALDKYQGDGCIYAAIALLHDVDRYFDAPGGAIIKYDPRTGDLTREITPFPHVYIQSTVIDQERGILYGQTFTPERLFAYDLERKTLKDLGPIGSGMAMAQGENIELDDSGCVWGNWGVTRAWQPFYGPDGIRLFRYSPDKGKIEYLNAGLPKPDESYGFEKAEGFFNLGTGDMYASGHNGSLYKFDPKTLAMQYIGSPITDRRSRLASLARMSNGKACGVIGRDGKTELLVFDPARDTYEVLGVVIDSDNNIPYQVHHVIATPEDVLYVAENDNHLRSSYLWEIRDIPL